MWDRIKTGFKVWFASIRPELISFLKFAINLGVEILLPIAGRAVLEAAQHKDLTGTQKFEFATEYVRANAPDAAMEAIVNAVRIEYTNKFGKLSKE